MENIDERASYLETYEGFDYYAIAGECLYAVTHENDGQIIEVDKSLDTLKDYIYLEYWSQYERDE